MLAKICMATFFIGVGLYFITSLPHVVLMIVGIAGIIAGILALL